jgi:hypothetical protein
VLLSCDKADKQDTIGRAVYLWIEQALLENAGYGYSARRVSSITPGFRADKVEDLVKVQSRPSDEPGQKYGIIPSAKPNLAKRW